MREERAAFPISEEAIRQNLLDAGCGNDTITAFLADLRAGKTDAGLRRLAQYRRALLEKLHEEHRHIYCLDYLIYQINS